jgi:hypothetical protein
VWNTGPAQLQIVKLKGTIKSLITVRLVCNSLSALISKKKSRAERTTRLHLVASRGLTPAQLAWRKFDYVTGRSRHFLTCIEYTKHLHHSVASPLLGFRNHEFTQNASNTVRQPGEFRPRSISSATPHDLYDTPHPSHRGVCHTMRISGTACESCGKPQ